MKMIIFGAGASYDAMYELYDGADESVWRPPLAPELFQPRSNFRKIFEKYRGLIAHYSELNASNDIEDYFQSKWDFAVKHKSKELFNSLISVQFALQELMYSISSKYSKLGLSNYDILVNTAYEYALKSSEDIIFLTFNYDLFLEQSIRRIFPNSAFSNEYLSLPEYLSFPLKLIKLHGSCNWFKKINLSFDLNPSIAEQVYQKKLLFEELESNLDKEVVVKTNAEQRGGQWGDQLIGFCPQLLIPFKSKDSFVLPLEHRKYLDEVIKKIDSILIIGWKGYEESFLEFLKENLSDKEIEIESVNCCNRGIEEHIKRYLPKAIFLHFEEDFTLAKNYSNKIYAGSSVSVNLNYDSGTFSAYCLRLMKGRPSSFFS
jgi:hypothetical protein